jgi:rhodanese-related sulfurtransferase
MKQQTVMWALVLFGSVAAAHGQTSGSIFQATLVESGQRTAEVSTEQLRAVIADKSAVVLDTRPFPEFAISHIPGAVNVSAKPGVPMSAYVSDVAEIGRLLEGKRSSLVLYCNGPYCGKQETRRGAPDRGSPTFVAISSVFRSGGLWAAYGDRARGYARGRNDRTTVHRCPRSRRLPQWHFPTPGIRVAAYWRKGRG